MKLYLNFLSMHLRCALEYKASFLLTILGQFLISFASFLGVYYMFARFNNVEGFSYSEVLLCFSVVLMSYSVAECFAYGFKTFTATISNGEFDRIMIRPCSELFLVFASKVEFSCLGRLLQAIVILIYAISNSPIIWTKDKILIFIFMIAGGIALFMGLYIIYASFCFFTIEGLEFMNIFTDGGREFGKYPMAIYGKSVLGFFTFIIPLACIQYYPLLYLLDRPVTPLAPYTPIYTFLFLIPCYVFWKIGVTNYKSTGS